MCSVESAVPYCAAEERSDEVQHYSQICVNLAEGLFVTSFSVAEKGRYCVEQK